MPKKKTPKQKLVFSREGQSHIRVLGIVLAGGKGSRLSPLTRERAKPAVPFGGK
jgi:transposase